MRRMATAIMWHFFYASALPISLKRMAATPFERYLGVFPFDFLSYSCYHQTLLLSRSLISQLGCFPADSLLFYSFNNVSGPRELPSTAVQVSLCSYFHFCDFDVESISRGGLFCIIFALFFGAFGGLKKKICRYITF